MKSKMGSKKTLTLEKEEIIMVSPTGEGIPTMRTAHFIKPVDINSTNQQNPPPEPPLHSHSSTSKKLSISDLTRKVLNKGNSETQIGILPWKTWVEKMQDTHKSIWQKVGIFEGIKASTYEIQMDDEVIVALAEKWCPETNTFVFSWGEATVTLEDVMILGGFSVVGDNVVSPCNDKKYDKVRESFMEAYGKIKRVCDGKKQPLCHFNWMKYFEGKGGELEHVAFLVLWLLRYVFPFSHYIVLSGKIFLVAIGLARGIKFALAPAVLASIYGDLRMLKERIVSVTSIGGNNDDYEPNWAPLQLVQLWAYERFRVLGPKPVPLLRGEPRVARWQKLRRSNVGDLRVELESAGDCFLWRPYSIFLKNWRFQKFYVDVGYFVVLNSEEDDEMLSFAMCVRPSRLVGMNSVEQYLPHRVGMQFGYDQDVPDLIARLISNRTLAWNSYAKPLDGWKLYVPPRLFGGDVTVQYFDWWRKGFALDETIKVYARKRKSVERVKLLSPIVHEGLGCPYKGAPDDHTSSPLCQKNLVSNVAGSTTRNPTTKMNLVVGVKEKRVNSEASAMQVDKETQVQETNVTTGCGSAHLEASNHQKSSPISTASHDKPEKQPSLERNSEGSGMEVDNETDHLNESNVTTVCGSHLLSEANGNRKGSLNADYEAVSLSELDKLQSSTLISEDKQERAEQNADKNQAYTSLDGLLISDDDDEEVLSVVDNFLALVSQLEERVSVAERKNASAKAANIRLARNIAST